MVTPNTAPPARPAIAPGSAPSLRASRMAHLSGLLLRHWGSRGCCEHDVAREGEIDRPVEEDAELLLDAGQLHPVDAAPQEPRREPREAASLDLGCGGTVSEPDEQADRPEPKRLRLAAGERGRDVLGDQL